MIFHSDSEELESTLSDNTVLISIPVKYEAGLIFSVWVAIEVVWLLIHTSHLKVDTLIFIQVCLKKEKSYMIF